VIPKSIFIEKQRKSVVQVDIFFSCLSLEDLAKKESKMHIWFKDMAAFQFRIDRNGGKQYFLIKFLKKT